MQARGRRGLEAPGETEPVAKQEGGQKVALTDPQRSQVSLLSSQAARRLAGLLGGLRFPSESM